jgi:hypothetical protein
MKLHEGALAKPGEGRAGLSSGPREWLTVSDCSGRSTLTSPPIGEGINVAP